MAIDLQKLEQKFEALFNDPNFELELEQWLEAWNISQNSDNAIVSGSLPPLPDIELALNMAQAELRYCYRTLGYKKSNVLMKVDEVLKVVQAAMPLV